MSLGRIVTADQALLNLQLHPRIAFPDLFTGDAQREKLLATLPDLVCFEDNRYQGVISLIDWDHRLPTTAPILRVFGFYDVESLVLGTKAISSRRARIEAADKFPEFNVPDFAGMPARCNAWAIAIKAPLPSG